MECDAEATAVISPELQALLSRPLGHVVVLTYAGMWVESGIRTFRDVQTELWAQYDPTRFATHRHGVRTRTSLWLVLLACR